MQGDSEYSILFSISIYSALNLARVQLIVLTYYLITLLIVPITFKKKIKEGFKLRSNLSKVKAGK